MQNFKKARSKFQLKSPIKSSFKMMGSSLKKVDGLTYADNYSVGTTSGQGASSTPYDGSVEGVGTYYMDHQRYPGEQEVTSRFLNESYGGKDHNQSVNPNINIRNRNKVDRNNPQGILSQMDVDKGYQQVRSPDGYWFKLNRKGEPIGTGMGNYSQESKNWMRGFKENPVKKVDTNTNTDTNNSTDNDREFVQNATVTSSDTGGSTVTDNDTGEIIQDDAHFDDSGRNLISGKLTDEDQSQGLDAIPLDSDTLARGLKVDSSNRLQPTGNNGLMDDSTVSSDDLVIEDDTVEETSSSDEYVPQSQRNRDDTVEEEVAVVDEDEDDDDDNDGGYIPQSQRRS
jgi:hypothetical protein